MNDEAASIVKYELPDAEHYAFERVGLALGLAPQALFARALTELFAIHPNPSPESLEAPAHILARLPAESRGHFAVACWWLRRSPALEVLAPAALFEEARLAELQQHDIPKTRAAAAQLARIAFDVAHPRQGEALKLHLAAIPEAQRATVATNIASALLAPSTKQKGNA
jgi:hypothetical protein